MLAAARASPASANRDDGIGWRELVPSRVDRGLADTLDDLEAVDLGREGTVRYTFWNVSFPSARYGALDLDASGGSFRHIMWAI